jgi:hypothetical protein
MIGGFNIALTTFSSANPRPDWKDNAGISVDVYLFMTLCAFRNPLVRLE